MNRSVLLGSLSIAAVGATLATTGYAHATASPGATIRIATRGAAGLEPLVGDETRLPDAPAMAASANTQDIAQVTFSRAADHVGRPVYFSRSTSGGSARLVSFSSRSLPSTAVFSVALRAPRLFSPSSPRGYSGSYSGAMPSLMPVSARAMTSGFGLRQHPILGTLRAHSGIDLAASYGSPIVATSDGMVDTANWAGGYGLLVALDHGGGLQTRYGHMSRLAVMPGQQVRKGEVIGYVGSTGRSTGPHLHYEIRVNGQAVNPASHLHGR